MINLTTKKWKGTYVKAWYIWLKWHETNIVIAKTNEKTTAISGISETKNKK